MTCQVESYFESLGFVCPPKVNPPDFFMDGIKILLHVSLFFAVISGDYLKSNPSKADITPTKLADIWEEKHNKPSLSFREPGLVNLPGEDDSDSELSVAESSKVFFSSRNLGTDAGFWVAFVLCFIFNVPAFFLVLIFPGMRYKSYYGGLFGYISSFATIGIISLIIASSVIVRIYVGLLVLPGIIGGLWLGRQFRERQPLGVIGGIIIGLVTGPVGLAVTLFNSFLVPKEKAGIKLGFLLLLLASQLFWYPYFLATSHISLAYHSIFWGIALFALTGVLAVIHHYPRLPNYSKTSSFWYQMWLFFKRGCVLMFRDWRGQ